MNAFTFKISVIERRHANGIGEKSLLGAGGHRSMRTWHSTGSAGMAKQNEMKTNEAQVRISGQWWRSSTI